MVADNLTNTAENLMLDWVNGVGSPTRPTTPLKVALVTANGTDTSAGTEVSGGSYARQNVTFTAASSGATANDAAITFTNMPAATIVGVEVWDSAGTPVRLWYGALAANKTTNSGDTFTIATGDLDLTLS
jgi:hypothetical protein